MPALTQAQEQLFHARRILGYTYVYAFYMFGGELYAAEIGEDQNVRNQSLFEDQQQQLESEVGLNPKSAPLCPQLDCLFICCAYLLQTVPSCCQHVAVSLSLCGEARPST